MPKVGPPTKFVIAAAAHGASHTFTVLYCTAPQCTFLYCILLYCTFLYCTVLYFLYRRR